MFHLQFNIVLRFLIFQGQSLELNGPGKFLGKFQIVVILIFFYILFCTVCTMVGK